MINLTGSVINKHHNCSCHSIDKPMIVNYKNGPTFV